MRRVSRTSIRRGAAAVEAAIILPVFLLIVLGTIDAGMAVFRYNTLSQAARQGARQAIVHGELAKPAFNGGPWMPAPSGGVPPKLGPLDMNTTTSPLVLAVKPALVGCPQGSTTVTAEWLDSEDKAGDRVRVTVASTYQPMVSWIWGGTAISLRASSTMTVAH
jgi:Flp pilus assembly protein TadG